MYQLIEQYQVPAPPEDFALFATLKPSIVAVRNAIDKAVGERDTSITQFCQHLDQDVLELNEEVKEVKQQAQVCQKQFVFSFSLSVYQNKQPPQTNQKPSSSQDCEVIKALFNSVNILGIYTDAPGVGEVL